MSGFLYARESREKCISSTSNIHTCSLILQKRETLNVDIKHDVWERGGGLTTAHNHKQTKCGICEAGQNGCMYIRGTHFQKSSQHFPPDPYISLYT